MSLRLTVRAKAFDGFVGRLFTITNRFGFSPDRILGQLDAYVNLLERFGTRATLPITATVLARYPDVARRLVERGVELAIHGLVHNDHATMEDEEQCTSIAAATLLFARAGLGYSGFRGPYLRSNLATSAALRRLGFRYHCSGPVLFPVLDADTMASRERGAFMRAIRLYDPLDARVLAVRPHEVNGLIDLPVALPDDEILVDRLHLSEWEQTNAWLAVLERTRDRAELFTLQLHPERFLVCALALEAVLRRARSCDPAVWIATLDEIATWWERRGSAALTLSRLEDGWIVELFGDRDVALMRTPSRQEHSLLSTLESPVPGYTAQFPCGRRPVVGVSDRTDPKVVAFFREEGYIVEVGASPGMCGAFFDVRPGTWSEAELLAAITNAPGPLARIGRWPRGYVSALAVTGDIDSVTLWDFLWRAWETWR
jgi:peptidoglycan/xylan/chitin deacetylase (PgdA/CDA1 family)